MTGIERLRKLIEDYRAGHECDGFECTELSCGECMAKNVLEPIADQIERERACDSDTAENIRLIVGGVIDEMERHCLGHEGMEDSPVARWARELREALKSDTSDGRGAQNPSWHDPADAAGVTSEAAKVTRDPAEDVSMSAYDLLPEEEREAIAWVREHGGLERVKKLLDWVVGHCSTRQQLDFDFWLSGRVMHELGFEEDVADRDEVERRLLARLMPDGYEWPRYESGEPLRYEDRYVYDGRECEVWHVDFDSYGEPTILNKDGTRFHPDKGKRIKRPAPKVLDADGVEIHEGDTVYYVDGREQKVNTVARLTDGLVQFGRINEAGYVTYCEGACISPDQLTHRAPVLAADGKPLREGEMVYSTENGDEFTVIGIDAKSGDVHIRWGYDFEDKAGTIAAELLTHERPVVDTWERIEEDAEKAPCDYFGFDEEEICGKCPASGKNCEQTMALDIVRRAKKLAGVDND